MAIHHFGMGATDNSQLREEQISEDDLTSTPWQGDLVHLATFQATSNCKSQNNRIFEIAILEGQSVS